MKSLLKIIILISSAGLYYGQNSDSLKLAYKELSATKRADLSDTTECEIVAQLVTITQGKENFFYSTLLKNLAENKIKVLAKTSPIARSYIKYLGYAENYLGAFYTQNGDYLRGLEHFYQSMKIDEEQGALDMLDADYNNIAAIYNTIGEATKATEYLKKSCMVAKLYGAKDDIAHALTNLGANYYTLKNYPEALKFLNSGLNLAEEVGSKAIQANALAFIGAIQSFRGEYDAALKSLEKSYRLSKQTDSTGEDFSSKINMVLALNRMGECYRLQKNYNKALSHSLEALKISQKEGLATGIRNASGTLKNIYKNLNMYKEALAMYELNVKTLDNATSSKIRMAAIAQQLNYELDKKELILKQEKERVKNLYEQKKKFYLAFIVSLIIVGIIVFIFFYLRHKFIKEKESKWLEMELKEKLKLEKNEKENIAHSLLHIEEEERTKLGAELHDGVNQLLFAAKMQLLTAKSTSEQIHKEGVMLVETAIQEINSIATNQSSFLLKDKLLKEALYSLIQQMKGNRAIELVFWDYGLDEARLAENQKTNVLRIIQELLNNTIRHSQAKKCFVSVKTKRNKLVFAVTDNGKGINLATMNKGNGLKNINNKVLLMKGTRRIFTIEKKGTKTYIQIPIS